MYMYMDMDMEAPAIKGLINIIDAKDGTKAGTLKVDQLAFSPIPVDGNLLFVTANGKLLSYK